MEGIFEENGLVACFHEGEETMRPIGIGSIMWFVMMLSSSFVAAGLFAWGLDPYARALPLGEVLLFLLTCLVFLAVSIFLYRVFLKFFPVPVGEIPEASREEFYYFVYLLHWLILFAPLTRATFIPAPFSRLMMISLGARVGPGSYSSGVVMDSQFVTVGSNTLIGLDVAVLPHALEGSRAAHYPIVIGNRVTIGARALIMAGVEIGDGAVVAMNSVVVKHTRIGPGEVWGGIPARCLSKPADSVDRLARS